MRLLDRFDHHLLCAALAATLSSGCGADVVSWQVTFACEGVAAEAHWVRTRLREQGCDGPVIYQATVGRADAAQAPPPPAVGTGRYGFEATALDVRERPIANVCREVQPQPGEVVTLFLADGCDASTPPEAPQPPVFETPVVPGADASAPPGPDEGPPPGPDVTQPPPGDVGPLPMVEGDGGAEMSDRDGDSVPDHADMCPDDPVKQAPGACGCGLPDADSDDDGALDCDDLCPEDPAKTAPGLCGCGTWDLDRDRDGTPDCNDECPSDRDKSIQGACGCGFADTDSDRDGVADCLQTPSLPLVQTLEGRTLRVERVTLNGQRRTRIEVAPGSSIALQVAGEVVANNTACANCETQLYVGLDGVMSLCLGSNVFGYRFDRSATFTAPQEPGVYFINTTGAVRRACIRDESVPRGLQTSTVSTIVVR